MPFVAAVFVIVSIVADGAMALDKAKAEADRRQIPERHLLGLSLIGGSIGTVLAQRMVRHKTRKGPFRSRLIGIVGLQIGLLILAAVAGPDRIAAGFTALTATPVAGQAAH